MAAGELFNSVMPVFSFLLIFIVVFAVLAKSKIIGESKFVLLLVSFIIASFFIANVSLADFVQFNVAWVAVFIVSLFLVYLVIGFAAGNIEFNKSLIAPLAFVTILFFVISSSYIFAWTINWDSLVNWAFSDWFSLVLLLAVAGIVSYVLTKS